MINPVVLIATHGRIQITTKNIESLQRQTMVPKIVLVVSDREELEYYKRFNITVVHSINNPVGRKWQVGVNAASQLDPNPLFILGSDDIFAPDYIERVSKLIDIGEGFIGLTSWLTLDCKSGYVYNCSYRNRNVDFPIGSGKAFSLKVLKDMRFKLFDSTKDKGLDDLSFHKVINLRVTPHLIRTPELLCVKGRWQVLNTVDAYLRSPNIESKKVGRSVINKFDYNDTI